jgi:2-oxoisovalerate dehydrogenase E1 component
MDHPAGLERHDLLRLYEQMVLVRRFERTAQELYRQGQWPGFIHLYIGEEATAVGVCAHLRPNDWITSTHRGHGHALAKGVPPRIVMAELFGKATGCCGGRGGSMHLYDPEHGLLGTNGLVGAGIPLAVGAGLSARVRGTAQVGVAFFGDGAVNHGAFHESINLAGSLNAPVVFVCENNLYATATPLAAVTRNTDVASRAAAYGVPGVAVDGNDVLAVWQAMREAVERARRGDGPTLIEARTYRTVGHHEGDPVTGVYRSQQEVDAWKERCPIALFRKQLLDRGEQAADLDAIDKAVEQQVQEAVEFARSSPDPEPATLHAHVWAEPIQAATEERPSGRSVVQGWLDAVRDGIAEEMRRDPHLIYLGEGTGERAGSFGHTRGLWQEFGPRRMIDTPISELGFTGAAIGAAATGSRAVADLMFADFLFEAASQIVHQAAKLRYMSNGRLAVPMLVRAAFGAVKNAGAHHSGSYYPMWAHIPGLLVAVPSNPADAKGLMKAALRASDPVLFLEHKALFASKGEVPGGEYLVPFGQACIVRPGTQVTLVSCGLYLHRCLEAARELEADDIDCEVIDLRTIVPLDVETIRDSVAKTHRVLVVDEAYAMCGIGAEITTALAEAALEHLDGPPGRLHPEPVTHPFSPTLDTSMAVTVEKIMAAVHAVLAGRPPVPRRLRAGRRRMEASPARPAGEVAAPTVAPQSGAARGAASAGGATGTYVRMPHGDLTVTEATVVAWLKLVGDFVRAGEGLVEVETDKAIVPVEAPQDGRLIAILAPAGTVVQHGQELAILEPVDGR